MRDPASIEAHVLSFDIESFLSNLDTVFTLHVYDKIGDDKPFSAQAELTVNEGANVEPYMMQLLARCPAAPHIRTDNMEDFGNRLDTTFLSSVTEVFSHREYCRRLIRGNYSRAAHIDCLINCQRCFAAERSYLLDFAYSDREQRLWRLHLEDIEGDQPACLQGRFSQTLQFRATSVHADIQKQHSDIIDCVSRLGLTITPMLVNSSYGFLLSAHTLADNGTIQHPICGFALRDVSTGQLYCHILYQHQTLQSHRTYRKFSDIYLKRTASDIKNIVVADAHSKTLFDGVVGKLREAGLMSTQQSGDSFGIVDFEGMDVHRSVEFDFERCNARDHMMCWPRLRVHFCLRGGELLGTWAPPGNAQMRAFFTRVALSDLSNPTWIVRSDSKTSTMSNDHFVSWITESVAIWHTQWRDLHVKSNS